VRRFGWFLIAGTIGFFADAGMLVLLLAVSPLGPFPARIVAILFALCVTWVFNRSLTFGKSRYPLLLEGARYGSVGLFSALFNYAIYAATLLIAPDFPPLVAVVIGSFCAMAFSWAGYSRFVFQK